MSRGTPTRNVRVPTELWERALARAQKEGTSVSAHIVQELQEWVEMCDGPPCPNERCRRRHVYRVLDTQETKGWWSERRTR